MFRRPFLVLLAALALAFSVALAPVQALAQSAGFGGAWTCSYFSYDAASNNRIERSYTLVLYDNYSYEAWGTHVASLIGIYERWISAGSWRIGGQSEGTPYVAANGTVQFNSGRQEQLNFWGWIQSANALASQYSQQGYQNQTSCAR